MPPPIVPRTAVPKDSPLPLDFQPGQYDVICSRGKRAFNHEGNKWFRRVIENHVDAYMAAPSKVDKSLLVITIVDSVRSRSPQGGFVRFSHAMDCFVEIGDILAREKVGHALRELINGKKRKEGQFKIRQQRPLTDKEVCMYSGSSLRSSAIPDKTMSSYPQTPAEELPLMNALASDLEKKRESVILNEFQFELLAEKFCHPDDLCKADLESIMEPITFEELESLLWL